jgi:arylsulfatase A-like enzyme
MLVKWPGKTTPNSVTDQQVIIEDFYPTILQMAGVENYQTVQKVDGISFVPVLAGNNTVADRPLFWHYPNEWGPSGPGIGASSSTRVGDWKFIYYYKDGSMELFNIIEDIGESKNLIGEQPEKAKELAKILSDYLRKVEAQIPSRKNTGEQIAYPDEVLNLQKT